MSTLQKNNQKYIKYIKLMEKIFMNRFVRKLFYTRRNYRSFY